MFKFPVECIKENIVFTKNNAYAGFKFGGFEYNSKSMAEKKAILYNLKELIKEIPSEAQILLVPRKISCRKSIEPMKNKIKEDDPLKESAEVLLEETIKVLEDRETEKSVFNEELEEDYLIDGEKEYKYDNYIFISLKDALQGDFVERGGEILEEIIKEPIGAINRYLGISEKYISDNRFKWLKKKAYSFLESQKNYIDIRKLKKKEIEALITRITKRGLAEPEDNLNVNHIKIEEVEEVIIPRRDAYKNRVKGAITQGNRYLKIDQGDKQSYQSFVSIIDIPELVFPGGEYIKEIQDQYPGSEICIHLKKFSTEESKRKLNSKERQLASQINEAAEGNHEVAEDIIEGKIIVEEFKREISGEDRHILETSITVCFSGTSETKVINQAKELTRAYNRLGFNLAISSTDQYKLFMEFIPGAGVYNKDYVSLNSIQTIAGSIFGANDKIGDELGVYIGYTTSGKKVYLYLGRAPQENMSPAMFIAGNLGYGKSFNANLILMLHVITGSSAVIFDPKSERSHWKESFDFMSDLISIVRLTASDEDKGKLDPFNVYKDDVDSACALASNITCDLLTITPSDLSYIALKEALIEIKNEKNRAMSKLIEILEYKFKNDDDEIRKAALILARQLKSIKESGMARLIIGDGTEDAIKIDNRVNILQIDNLKIPEKETKKDEYTEEERISTCLMTLMSNFTKKFAMKKSDTFDIILFDESWFLKRTQEGRKLFEFLARQGRSLNVGCIFNGHSVLDVPSEELKNTLSYKLFFHTDNEDEAKRMLKFMEMEESNENIKMLTTLKNREAIFQDLDGRVSKIIFDGIFDIFIDTFKTTPEDTINLNDKNNKDREK